MGAFLAVRWVASSSRVRILEAYLVLGREYRTIAPFTHPPTVIEYCFLLAPETVEMVLTRCEGGGCEAARSAITSSGPQPNPELL